MKNESNEAIPRSTRRDFVKTAGIAAAGAAFAPRIAGAFAGGSDEIKVGLVGCGGKGNSDIRQALGTEGKVKLWALGDAFEDRVNGTHSAFAENDKFKEKTDCKDRLFSGFDAFKQVVDSGVDVVFLVTTPGFRPMHFEYAIAQGKNVFMQKPCAVDGAGVRKLLAANEDAKKKGLKVGVGLQRRHDPRYIETVKKIQDGAIGDVVSMRAYWDGQTPWVRPRQEGQSEMEYQMRNWYYFNWLCGDHICEQHIHNIDVCNWIMGDNPGLAQGKGGCEVRKGPDYGETFDHHVVEFVYGKKWDTAGVRMHSSCRHIPGCWGDVSEQVHGTNGSCHVGSGRLYDRQGAEVWRSEAGGDAEQLHKQKYLDAIRNNTEFNEGDNGGIASMTAIFGRMTTYSGKLLKWDDCLNTKVDVFPSSPDFKWDWNGEAPVKPGPDGLYALPVPGVTQVV